MSTTDQFSTARPLLKNLASWVGDPQEQKRIAAYELYENIYWLVPDTFTLYQRGTDSNPIYLPSARKIIEVMHRFTAPAISFVTDPDIGTESEQKAAFATLVSLLRRERFASAFTTNKREGLFRGDWLWHLYADPERPEGSRISIQTMDPSSWFPIYNEDNIEEIIGVHIVEQFLDNDSRPMVRRLTYEKESGTGGPSTIFVSEGIYEPDKWGGPGMPEEEAIPVRIIRQEEALPSPIDQLPVYNIPNLEQTGTIYGSSELRGFERILAAINQTISDEELALALEGLGVYATNAGQPVDENGDDVPWDIGPGRVVNLPTGSTDAFFSRVSGISSIQPFMDHMNFLDGSIRETLGISDVAAGRVDVQVAESGIALQLELAPLLAHSGEKDQTITDVITNMMFDLRKWFLAYEGSEQRFGMENVQFLPVYGDKIPQNRASRFKEIMDLLNGGVVSLQWAWSELEKIGYHIGDATEMITQMAEEKTLFGAIESDAMGARLDNELNNVSPPTEDDLNA